MLESLIFKLFNTSGFIIYARLLRRLEVTALLPFSVCAGLRQPSTEYGVHVTPRSPKLLSSPKGTKVTAKCGAQH